MMTGHQVNNEYNYQDYVPTEGITCPICNINCPSLQSLNSHLDVDHNEEDSKGALLSWLRNAQKVFSKPETPSLLSLPALKENDSFFVSDTLEHSNVTRDHWQRETGHDLCQACNIKTKPWHCRCCGHIYCQAHLQYEIRLDRHAHHDVEGTWSKVCVNCFVARPGYMDHDGATRSKTDILLKARSKTIDRVYLESNRLEKRLEKLAKIHQAADGFEPGLLSPSSASLLSQEDSISSRDSLGSMLSPKSSFVSNNNSILSMKLKYRDGEQSVTKWQDDKSVKTCPYCENNFTLINRKHHCRLCGKVVCGNSRCSKMIPLFIDMSSLTFDDEPVGDTRACRDCQRSVFRRKLRHEESSKPLPIIQLYNQLSITRKNIERQLPKFHETILMLEKNTSAQSERFVKAATIRKSLLDNFTLYDTLAKSIKVLPVRSACMKRLQSNICFAANLYLQQNMLPLQMLPRILKSSTDKKPVKKNKDQLEVEAQLEAYMEQYTLVEGFIKEAHNDRKYDDEKTLKLSLQDLHLEITRLKALLG